MAVKIAVEMAVETAARRTKPAFAGSPQPTSQSATADFVWIAAISIAGADRILNKSRDRPWIVTAASKCL
jgi:hypothetical protein